MRKGKEAKSSQQLTDIFHIKHVLTDLYLTVIPSTSSSSSRPAELSDKTSRLLMEPFEQDREGDSLQQDAKNFKEYTFALTPSQSIDTCFSFYYPFSQVGCFCAALNCCVLISSSLRRKTKAKLVHRFISSMSRRSLACTHLS